MENEAGPNLLVLLVPLAILAFQLVFFIKLWMACNDIADLLRINRKTYDLDQDLQFWARTKYESDRRLGVITEDDLTKTENYLNRNLEK
jgi:hypothetical protein